MTPRALAFIVLGKVLLKGDHANELLSREASRHGMAGRDRGFLWELTLGTLRWMGRLDWVLARYVKGYQGLPLETKNVLRLSAYQLLYMDRVPPYSAVDEGMKLAKKWCPPRHHGLVNAVLRKVAKGPYPGVVGMESSLEAAATAYAHPLWLVKRWRKRMDMLELLQFLRANNGKAPFSAWVNHHLVEPNYLRKELKAQGVECKPHPFLEDIIIIITPVDVAQLPQFSHGLVHPQDPASSLVVRILEPRPGERILDACAAPGIKTVQMAWAMGNQGEILACDVHPARLTRMEETLKRSGVTIVEPILGDVVDVVRDRGPFQRILLDAPCSDLGTLRRHPELKWRRKEGDIALFAEKQRRLFTSLVDRLVPGGIMVYSVCSPEPEEGETLVEEVLKGDHRLEPVDFGHLLPEAIRPYYKKEGFLTLYPHYANTDGFFIAKVRRRD